ncbi:hypothetical protein KGF54_005095 [Candida jiufengensis]|uniref:uncharacterized protein n=1 Tax=Candida jiufengensis TaxID=497108 RepID=UPI002225044B|nr:uncharacterized protein KGF54_005095 [Candida jiufengensis]KAI5952020.1 hypothetical protein KGF54_005095 [Candida jiufengensis]
MEYPEDTPRSRMDIRLYDSDVEEIDDKSMLRQKRKITTLPDDSSLLNKNSPVTTPTQRKNRNRLSPIKSNVFVDRISNSPLSKYSLQNSPTKKPISNREEVYVRDDILSLKSEVRSLKKEILKRDEERLKRDKELELENLNLKEKLNNSKDIDNNDYDNNDNDNNNNKQNSIQCYLLQSENNDLNSKLKKQIDINKKYKYSNQLWESRFDTLQKQYNGLLDVFKLQSTFVDMLKLQLDNDSKNQISRDHNEIIKNEELVNKVAELIKTLEKTKELNTPITTSSTPSINNITSPILKKDKSNSIATKVDKSILSIVTPDSTQSKNSKSNEKSILNQFNEDQDKFIEKIIEGVSNKLNLQHQIIKSPNVLSDKSSINSHTRIHNKSKPFPNLDETHQEIFNSPLAEKKFPQKLNRPISTNQINKSTQTSIHLLPGQSIREEVKDRKLEESEINEKISENSTNQGKRSQSVNSTNQIKDHSSPNSTDKLNENFVDSFNASNISIRSNKSSSLSSSTSKLNTTSKGYEPLSKSFTSKSSKHENKNNLNSMKIYEEQEDKTQELNLNEMFKLSSNCCDQDKEYTASCMIKGVEIINKS